MFVLIAAARCAVFRGGWPTHRRAAGPGAAPRRESNQSRSFLRSMAAADISLTTNATADIVYTDNIAYRQQFSTVIQAGKEIKLTQCRDSSYCYAL